MERDSYSYSLHELQHQPLYRDRGLLRAPPPLSLLRHSAPPQPPLLPLPATLPRRSSSCPTRKPRPVQKKSTKSLTKNNINTNIPKKEDKKTPEISSTTVKDDRLLGSAVFAISPPPSSLPLPSFCLRPKLSCNAAAADDLRRFLRLQ